jgi:hypothetical protein
MYAAISASCPISLLLSFSPKLAEPKFGKKIKIEAKQNTLYLAEYQLKSHRFKTICKTEVVGTQQQMTEMKRTIFRNFTLGEGRLATNIFGIWLKDSGM